ncbi:unnamed protein product, partial [Allacma fusca]
IDKLQNPKNLDVVSKVLKTRLPKSALYPKTVLTSSLQDLTA